MKNMKQKILQILLLTILFLSTLSSCKKEVKNYIVLEADPEEMQYLATYPFKIKGTNMFLDINNNGFKDDEDKELANDFNDFLSLLTNGGKANFVIRGDIKEFSVIGEYNPIGNHLLFDFSGSSKIDVSNCQTIELLSISDFNLTKVNLGNLKFLKTLNLTNTKVDSLDLKGVENLEKICLENNIRLREAFDLSSCSKIKIISFLGTPISSLIIPKSKSCEILNVLKTNLRSIDLSNGENIESLSYGSSVAKELDISLLNKLKFLELDGYELFKLIDNNPHNKKMLVHISLGNTNLTDFDFSKYEVLEKIEKFNRFGVDYDILFSRLPNITGNKTGLLDLFFYPWKEIFINNPILQEKNWKVK